MLTIKKPVYNIYSLEIKECETFIKWFELKLKEIYYLNRWLKNPNSGHAYMYVSKKKFGSPNTQNLAHI